MKYMRRYAAHLRRELKHKWFVFIECSKLGIPWLGLIHDWSKFTPGEFFPYARNYYTKDGVQLPKQEALTDEYNVALLQHLNSNKHHPEYWILKGQVLAMPDRYRKEMLADWLGYEQTNHVETRELYYRLRDDIVIHPETREWIEAKLE